MATGIPTVRYKLSRKGTRSPLSSVTTTDSAESTTSTSSEELNLAKDQQQAGPSSAAAGGEAAAALPRQSRSNPSSSTASGGTVSRFFGRNSSVSSQSSLEGASGSSSHRASSPQIRAFGPDGRYRHDPLQAAASYPPSRDSRSPSPGRAASLDARSGSPSSFSGSLTSHASASQSNSLSSLATGSSPCACSSLKVAQRSPRSTSRSLSPLLIPPTRSYGSEGGPPPPASPLGTLQPDLYQRRHGPIFLHTRRTGRTLGRLHLRLKYDFDRSDLNVHLIEAHDLPSTEDGGFNDPYVKLSLSPEVDSRKRQTQIYRHEPNPFFDQQFTFPISTDELQDRMLVLQVFDYDRLSRNDVVGSVRIALDSLELVSSPSSIEIWGEIESERKPPEQIQEILISLSYLPSAERLTVLILKAQNLFPPQNRQTLDAFVKVNLLRGEKRVKKRKTSVQKGTTNPVWNEAMSFDIPSSSLAACAIEVCVMDTSNAFVGACIIGPSKDAVPDPQSPGNRGREHWLQMTESPRKTIAMWHPLH